jgi:hypothetical protein
MVVVKSMVKEMCMHGCVEIFVCCLGSKVSPCVCFS